MNKKKILLSIAGVVILIYASITVGYNIRIAEQEKTPPSSHESKSIISQKTLMNAVNDERKKNKLPNLTLDARLDSSAQYKASDMDALKYFAHVNPSGTQGYDLILKTMGNSCISRGENLAEDFSSVEDTVNAWMNSPTHKEVILNPAYNLTGFGISGSYIVEHFCQTI